jgi:hypothetical protein
MNEKAQQQRARAENLQRMATTNKGDAAKGYAARAEQVKASYGGIKKGTMVESILYGGGPATVIRANAKSVTMKMSDGRVINQPYERLKLKSPTLGSSKVVDGAKVSRMAARLGAKSRAPKSSSPVKNANTVAVRAKAVSFLTGKGGTFPNAAAARASMAANIRNRPVFSTGKKAAVGSSSRQAATDRLKIKTQVRRAKSADRGSVVTPGQRSRLETGKGKTTKAAKPQSTLAKPRTKGNTKQQVASRVERKLGAERVKMDRLNRVERTGARQGNQRERSYKRQMTLERAQNFLKSGKLPGKDNSIAAQRSMKQARQRLAAKNAARKQAVKRTMR